MFHVGQLVTPKDRSPRWVDLYSGSDSVPSPRYGCIYTVAALAEQEGYALIGLVEMPPNCGYLADAFRPLSEARLAVFRSMLSPTPKQEVEA